MDFNEALHEANLSNINNAASFFGVTLRTIHRWLASQAPALAWRALELRCGLDPYWRGFRVMRDQIIRHDGVRFDAHILTNWEWILHLERTRAWTAGIASDPMPSIIQVLNKAPVKQPKALAATDPWR